MNMAMMRLANTGGGGNWLRTVHQSLDRLNFVL